MILSLCRSRRRWTGGAFLPSSRWMSGGKLLVGTLRGLERQYQCHCTSNPMLFRLKPNAFGSQTPCFSNVCKFGFVTRCALVICMILATAAAGNVQQRVLQSR